MDEAAGSGWKRSTSKRVAWGHEFNESVHRASKVYSDDFWLGVEGSGGEMPDLG